MRAIALAVIVVFAAAGGALAETCRLPQDGAAWNGADRTTARALCFERELSRSTETLADDTRWRTDFGSFAARTELLLQQQRALSTVKPRF